MPNHSSLLFPQVQLVILEGPHIAVPDLVMDVRQDMLESQALLLSCLSDPLHCRPPIQQSKLQWDEEASLVALAGTGLKEWNWFLDA